MKKRRSDAEQTGGGFLGGTDRFAGLIYGWTNVGCGILLHKGASRGAGHGEGICVADTDMRIGDDDFIQSESSCCLTLGSNPHSQSLNLIHWHFPSSSSGRK